MKKAKKSRAVFQVFLAVLVISMNAWTFEWLRRLDPFLAVLFSFAVLAIFLFLTVRAERELTRRADAADALGRLVGHRHE